MSARLVKTFLEEKHDVGRVVGALTMSATMKLAQEINESCVHVADYDMLSPSLCGQPPAECQFTVSFQTTLVTSWKYGVSSPRRRQLWWSLHRRSTSRRPRSSLSPRPADRGMPVDGVFQQKTGYKIEVRSVAAKTTMSAIMKLAKKIDVSVSDVVTHDYVVPRPCRGVVAAEGSSLSRRFLHWSRLWKRLTSRGNYGPADLSLSQGADPTTVRTRVTGVRTGMRECWIHSLMPWSKGCRVFDLHRAGSYSVESDGEQCCLGRCAGGDGTKHSEARTLCLLCGPTRPAAYGLPQWHGWSLARQDRLLGTLALTSTSWAASNPNIQRTRWLKTIERHQNSTYSLQHRSAYLEECVLLSCVACFEDWSSIFRTRSFTLCRNDLDFNDMSDSATVLESTSSSSITNLSVCCVNRPAGCSLTSLSVLASSTSSDCHSWEDHFSSVFDSE